MTALLELDAVDKAFGSVVVADSLSFTLAAGEAIGIVGPNGAGKTSMLNLVSGNLAPDRGRILFDGRPIQHEAPHVRARLGIGRTYQIPRPFSGMSVFENVQIAACYAGALRGDQADAAAVGALVRTGLLARANAMAGSLPLLDRKRLELARGLAGAPRVLLLDEIAGGLTEAEVHELVETIGALKAEGVAIVWIEHIVRALFAIVDRLIATDGGRKLADGEPVAVLRMPEVRAVYLGQDLGA